jgi:hypothetical protein
MQRTLVVLVVVGLLFCPDASQSQLVRRCTFNRACTTVQHVAIATGVTWSLERVGVDPLLSAATATAVFAGKEIRDHAKWGRNLDRRDSSADLLAGIAGSLIGLALFVDSQGDSAGTWFSQGRLAAVRNSSGGAIARLTFLAERVVESTGLQTTRFGCCKARGHTFDWHHTRRISSADRPELRV